MFCYHQPKFMPHIHRDINWGRLLGIMLYDDNKIIRLEFVQVNL